MKKPFLLWFVVLFCWFQLVPGARQSVEWSVNSDQDLSGMRILPGNDAGFHSTFGFGNQFFSLNSPEPKGMRFFEDSALLCSGLSSTLLWIQPNEDRVKLSPPSIDNMSQKTSLSIIVFNKSTRASA